MNDLIKECLKRTLPGRHLNLIETIMEIWDGKSELGKRDVIRNVSEGELAGCWNFWRDDAGTIQSRQVEEDLSYLNLRGYLFETENHVIPTRRAIRLYEKLYKKTV